METNRIVYEIPGMESITPRRDLVYKTADGEPLEADFYLPEKDAGRPHPVVIFIHGAVPKGVKAKGMAVFVSWGQLIAASGMAAVTFNHRAEWQNGFVEGSLAKAATDLADLIAFVHENAREFDLDPQRICLFSFSAGGPLLAAPIRTAPGYLRCIVSFYSFLDDPSPDPRDPGALSTVTALSQARGRTAPIFVAKAGHDMPLLNASIDRFVKEARCRGVTIEMMEHAKGHHGFDANDNDDESRAIIRRSVEFMKSHLERQ
jgi:dienelactone hydrolase